MDLLCVLEGPVVFVAVKGARVSVAAALQLKAQSSALQIVLPFPIEDGLPLGKNGGAYLIQSCASESVLR